MAVAGFPDKYTQLWAHTKAGDFLDDDTVYPDGITVDSPLEEILQASVEGGGGGGLDDPEITSADTTRWTQSIRRPRMTMGPASTFATTAAQAPGVLTLGFTYVRGGTPDELLISVSTGSGTAGDECYYVLYNYDSTGLPTTLAHSWGPFDVETLTGPTVTGQTDTVVAGWYWAGTLMDTNNTGSPAFHGAEFSFSPTYGSYNQPDRTGIATGDTGESTPVADISSYTFNSTAGATVFAPIPSSTPTLQGGDTA